MKLPGWMFSAGILLLISIAAVTVYDSGVSYSERTEGAEIYRERLLYGQSTGDVEVFYSDGTPKLHMWKDLIGTQHYVRFDEQGNEVDHIIKD
ncbi:MAG TPA: hypothetical protein VGM98_04600 [Schlesneria sp.]|jgi:hypothetical protein